MYNKDIVTGVKKRKAQIEINQAARRIKFRIFMIPFILWFFLSAYFFIGNQMMNNAFVYVSVSIYNNFTDKEKTFYYFDGIKKQPVLSSEIDNNKTINDSVFYFKILLILDLLISIAVSIFISKKITRFFIKSGDKEEKIKLIRGAEKVTEEELKELIISQDRDSDLKVGNTPLIRDCEIKNILVSGSPGSGKSSTLAGFFDTVRARKQRFFVFDKTGEFVNKFYREGHDIILNPYDERSAYWTPWHDIKMPYDAMKIATCMVGEVPGADPFWEKSPKQVLKDVLFKLHKLNRGTPQEFINAMFDDDIMYELLKGTPSQKILNAKATETAGSIESIIGTHITTISLLRDGGQYFSARDWVQEDSDKCVFITAYKNQFDTLKPLISTWLSLIITEILSLPESKTRRIFGVFDEMGSLPRISSIIDGLNEGRKHGLCNILSFTSLELLINTYNSHIAEAMMGICQTKITFNCDEPNSASRLAKMYCEEEFVEQKEGMSFSENNNNINLHDQRQKHQLFIPTEFMQLPPFNCILKVGRDLPMAKVKVPEIKRTTIATNFVAYEDFEEIEAEQVNLKNPNEEIANNNKKSNKEKSKKSTTNNKNKDNSSSGLINDIESNSSSDSAAFSVATSIDKSSKSSGKKSTKKATGKKNKTSNKIQNKTSENTLKEESSDNSADVNNDEKNLNTEEVNQSSGQSNSNTSFDFSNENSSDDLIDSEDAIKSKKKAKSKKSQSMSKAKTIKKSLRR